MSFTVGAKYRVAKPEHIAEISGVVYEQDQVITCSGVYPHKDGDSLACKEGNFLGVLDWEANEVTPFGWSVAGSEELENGALVLVE